MGRKPTHRLQLEPLQGGSKIQLEPLQGGSKIQKSVVVAAWQNQLGSRQPAVLPIQNYFTVSFPLSISMQAIAHKKGWFFTVLENSL